MDIKYNKEFYTNFRKFVKFYMNTFYKLNVSGIENIPQNKNYLLAGNHLNIFDSWLLISQIDYNLRFMVDIKLYNLKLAEIFFKSLGTFSIDPSKMDLTAIKTAVNLLKCDNVVIFPEGKTHNFDEEVPFKSGVASIAKLANAELIPFGINGSYHLGSTINLNIGEPINLNNYKKCEYDEVLESHVRTLEKRH